MRRTALAAGAILALSGSAFAQDEAPATEAARPQVGAGVAAVVNDRPISTFDVQQRVRLMAATSGAQLTEEAFVQLQRQALRDLIEQELKLAEASEFEQLGVGDEEVEAEIARMAAGGGASPQQLAQQLASQGIAIDTLRDQIRADLLWERLVSGRYGNRVSVSEAEVEDELSRLRASTREPQYLLSEICLPADDQAQTEQMANVGMQMIDQMRQGVPFQALAQQFSACPSAARGGDLGWLGLDAVDPALRPVVTRLAQGNVSLPVPSEGMVKLVALREARQAATAGEPSYQVVYAGAPKSVGRQAAAAAFERLPLTNGCASDRLSEDLGEGVGVTPLPMLPASAFEPAFRPALAALGRNQVSDVIEGDTAYHAVLLCARDEGLGLPSRDQIRAQLRNEELERQSRRYLRDVERDSAVDVRLGQATQG